MHLGFILYFHSHAHDYSLSCKKPTPVRGKEVALAPLFLAVDGYGKDLA
jgi:hypothetical protein